MSRYAGTYGDRHREPHTADLLRQTNTAVQSEADTRLTVTHSGPGPALSLHGGGGEGPAAAQVWGRESRAGGLPGWLSHSGAPAGGPPLRLPLPQVRSEPVTPRFYQAK